ncbi:hypothetical protein BDF19DRAFT_425641 [Syncephalis fuscata]|nr:hypothetical protein BDF19DRAFT_425641 [Syncephalis fuscata]
MPCILKVKVLAARDLPVMDRKSELTDAYVEIRYAEFEPQRTDIARKTLSPVWNEDFRYEVSDDADLQDEPLELRVLDYDAITANDEVIDWRCHVRFESFIVKGAGWTVIWLVSIYDTLRGTRGELHIQVRLQFFGDANPFNDSSAGVAFLSGAQLPPLGRSTVVALGFVDAIESERDPEYHWSDNFRTPRASNEARQRLLFRLSGRLRRALGVKVLDLGGNAVTGYRHWFDLEQEEGIIMARAVGCAVRLGLETASAPTSLEKQHSHSHGGSVSRPSMSMVKDANTGQSLQLQLPTASMKKLPSGQSQPHSPVNSMHSMSSRDSEMLMNGGSGGNALFSRQFPTSPAGPSRPRLRHRRANSILSDHHSLAPYAFRTTDQELFAVDTFPPGAIIRLGGLVTAKSVKLIDSGNPTIREAWWNELREEIRGHARTLGCSSVIGYAEMTAIHDDLCVLSVTGTAAIIELGSGGSMLGQLTSPISHSFMGNNERRGSSGGGNGSGAINSNSGVLHARKSSYEPNSTMMSSSGSHDKAPWASRSMPSHKARRIKRPSGCRMLHLPYHRSESPFTMNYVKCGCCRKRFVPEILLTTVERPSELDIVGEGCFVQAHLCRAKKRKEGESNATIISEAMPFIEYDIHRQLVYKLRIQGMNAIFGLRIELAIGDSLIVAVATGMAYYLTALPTPPALRIARNLEVLDEEDRNLLELQRRIMILSEQNRATLDHAFQMKKQQQQLDNSSNNAIIITTTNMDAIPIAYRSSPWSHPVLASASPSNNNNKNSNNNNNNNNNIIESESSSSSSSDSEDELDAEARRRHAVVHIDDDTDEDLLAVLLDPVFGDTFKLSCELAHPPRDRPYQMVQLVHVVKQSAITSMDHHPNRQFSNIIRQLYEELRVRLLTLEPCLLGGIQLMVQLPHAYEVQVQLIASVLQPVEATLSGGDEVSIGAKGRYQRSSASYLSRDEDGHVIWPASQAAAVDPWTQLPDDEKCAAEELASIAGPLLSQRTLSEPVREMAQSLVSVKSSPSNRSLALLSSLALHRPVEQVRSTTITAATIRKAPSITQQSELTAATVTTALNSWRSARPPRSILLTPLRVLPLPRIEHLGRVALHFVKESHAGYDTGALGIGSFTRLFLAEVHASVKAYAAALGGDAVVAFSVDASQLLENAKGHTYALACISGDVIRALPDSSDDEDSTGDDSSSNSGNENEDEEEEEKAQQGGKSEKQARQVRPSGKPSSVRKRTLSVSTENDEQLTGKVAGYVIVETVVLKKYAEQDADQVQIRQSKSQVEKRILGLMQRKRADIDKNNTEYSARTNPTELNRTIQMKLDVVDNGGEPLSRLVAGSSLLNKASSTSTTSSPWSKPIVGNTGVDERLRNIEQHLNVQYATSVPIDIYERLKVLEDKIMQLEREHPTWAAIHFNQPGRTFPPPPTPTIVKKSIRGDITVINGHPPACTLPPDTL